MLKLLITEKRILSSGTVYWLAQTEDGVAPERFHTMMDSNGDGRLIMLEAIWNDDPSACDAWLADPERHLEEVTIWTSEELGSHLPKNVRWAAHLRWLPETLYAYE